MGIEMEIPPSKIYAIVGAYINRALGDQLFSHCIGSLHFWRPVAQLFFGEVEIVADRNNKIVIP